ncbi:ribbon-helix-helix domain-containing protein [Kineococcus sp. GCM10028916]|uniref:ribbon-helix-helix domain-containing protein n=1 Tax=Kineococcus sp. GCM10028916 TaxID=3273394 RepID=UPI003630C471
MPTPTVSTREQLLDLSTRRLQLRPRTERETSPRSQRGQRLLTASSTPVPAITRSTTRRTLGPRTTPSAMCSQATRTPKVSREVPAGMNWGSSSPAAPRTSISLSEADVAALDEHVRAAGLPSRSAAVQQAVRALTHQQLEQDYAAAWKDWDDSGDREVWEGVTADGLR